MGIEVLLGRLLGVMPNWAKIVSFFVLLTVSVYLLLAPRIVTSQVVAETRSGGIVPYRAAPVQMELLGHILRFKTNETGHVTLPLVNRLPSSMKFQIFHEDERSWHDVEISIKNIWWDTYRIVVNDSVPLFSVKHAGNSDSDASVWETLGLMPSAQAQILFENDPNQLGLQAITPVSADGPPSELQARITDIVSNVTGVSSAYWIDNPLLIDRNITYIDRIEIVENVESEFDIKIPDEHWRDLISIDSLATYTHDRLFLQGAYPGVENFRSSVDWAEIQSAIPEFKPVFVSPILGTE